MTNAFKAHSPESPPHESHGIDRERYAGAAEVDATAASGNREQARNKLSFPAGSERMG